MLPQRKPTFRGALENDAKHPRHLHVHSYPRIYLQMYIFVLFEPVLSLMRGALVRRNFVARRVWLQSRDFFCLVCLGSRPLKSGHCGSNLPSALYTGMVRHGTPRGPNVRGLTGGFDNSPSGRSHDPSVLLPVKWHTGGLRRNG